jgi:hypothetical protein
MYFISVQSVWLSAESPERRTHLPAIHPKDRRNILYAAKVSACRWNRTSESTISNYTVDDTLLPED